MNTILEDYVAWIALPDGQTIEAADIRLETDLRGRHRASSALPVCMAAASPAISNQPGAFADDSEPD